MRPRLGLIVGFAIVLPGFAAAQPVPVFTALECIGTFFVPHIETC